MSSSQEAARSLLDSLRPEVTTSTLDVLADLAGAPARVRLKRATSGPERLSLTTRRQLASTSTDPAALLDLVRSESAITVLYLVLGNDAADEETLVALARSPLALADADLLAATIDKLSFSAAMTAVESSDRHKDDGSLARALLDAAERDTSARMVKNVLRAATYFERPAISFALGLWATYTLRYRSVLKGLRSQFPGLARDLLFQLVGERGMPLTRELCETYLGGGIMSSQDAYGAINQFVTSSLFADRVVSKGAADFLLDLQDPNLHGIVVHAPLAPAQVHVVLKDAPAHVLQRVADTRYGFPIDLELFRALRLALLRQPKEVKESVSFAALGGNLDLVEDGGVELYEIVVEFLRWASPQAQDDHVDGIYQDDNFARYLLGLWSSPPPTDVLSRVPSSSLTGLTSTVLYMLEIYRSDLDVPGLSDMLLALPGAFSHWQSMGRSLAKQLVGEVFYTHLQGRLGSSRPAWEVAMSLASEFEGSVSELTHTALMLSETMA